MIHQVLGAGGPRLLHGPAGHPQQGDRGHESSNRGQNYFHVICSELPYMKNQISRRGEGGGDFKPLSLETSEILALTLCLKY